MNGRIPNVLVTIVLAAIAFGLGWILKPDPDPAPSPAIDSIGGGKLSAAFPRPVPMGTPLLESDRAEPPGLNPEIGPGSGPPLESSQIESLGKIFRESLDPFERRSAFLKLIEGMTAENAREIREQIAHLEANSPAFRDFHYAWGKIAGVDAIMHGDDTPKADMAATYAGWASADPAAALDWFNSLPPESSDSWANQKYLMAGMVHGLADADPDIATEFVLEFAGEKRQGSMINIVTGKVIKAMGVERASAWAGELPPGNARRAAAASVAQNYAKKDPEAAASWVESFIQGGDDARTVPFVSGEWARRDGAAAVTWLESLGENGEKAYGWTFSRWASKDPAAAGEYIGNMPASDVKDNAIGGLVHQYRWENPEAAILWAGEITKTEDRSEALVRAGHAYYRTNPGAAKAWLDTSGLDADQQSRVISGKAAPRKK